MAVDDIGGLARFAKMMSMYGLPIHRQTVHGWARSGSIPAHYMIPLRKAVTQYSHVFRDIAGLMGSIRKEGGPRGTLIFPNAPLEAWFKERGGIAAFVRTTNNKIRHHNATVENERDKQKLWSYIMVHNWLKRGRISDGYRSVMKHNFDCPAEIMGPELKKPAAELDRAAQLLGEE